MWVILQANHILGAHHLCPRNSNWQRENKCYQKVVHPTTVTEVQSCLGLTGYSHWFIPKFVQIIQPLHELMSSKNTGKKRAAITWNDKCLQSFNELKCMCTTAPILAYTDFMKPCKLHTNACRSGLGAIFYEVWDDGTDAIISYASRSLTKAETLYLAHTLQLLALKWVVVEKFHEYLYGSTFDIYTDNNPLTYILTMAKLDVLSHCWVASLASYNFQLYYRVGRANIDAEAMLRVPGPCVCLTLWAHTPDSL